MRTICMYCRIVLSQGDGTDDRVSHGLCKRCYHVHCCGPLGSCDCETITKRRQP